MFYSMLSGSIRYNMIIVYLKSAVRTGWLKILAVQYVEKYC